MELSPRVLIVLLALPPSIARADQPSAPAVSNAASSLAGRWTLDTAKSEDGRQKMREAMPSGGARGPRGGGAGGPGGGGFGGGGGGRGGGPGGRGGPGGGGSGDAMRSVMEAPPGLTITETPEEITIVEEDGRFRALHPDRKEYKGTGGEKITTRREGAQIVVETKGDRGPKLVETFEVAGEELVTLLRIEGGRGQPVTVRRVYRRPTD